ncbi:MAG TPA: lipoyl(octanoyl) transferase LipB [Bacteroidota bacterium]|nr:lipoyl(octanoyl) transferase LipB [Bacteroidota bacterium]
MKQITSIDIGRTRYADAWDLQGKLFDMRRERRTGDMLLYTEHNHVYTIGKGGDQNHLLATKSELEEGGVDVFQIDRGGDITYHGPGQIVGYPIIDLQEYRTDLHWYLRSLEDVVIRAIREYGLEGGREDGMTGVWVGGEKIAAIGVKVSRWITMHGFALNVNTDLSKFGRIIPCGIFHKGVTSMERMLGRRVEMSDVHDSLDKAFENVFGRPVTRHNASVLKQLLESNELEKA